MNAHRIVCALAVASLAGTLGGCATTQSTSAADPLEPFNRTMYAIHEPIDRGIVRPFIRAYVDHVPSVIRTPISNFFNYIEDFLSGVNGVLQGKPDKAGHDFGRVIVNTFGLVGLIDIATEAGIPRGEEDFGQTLGHWGVPQGPFLFVPLFGPTTVRDGTGVLVRLYLYPIRFINDWAVRDVLWGIGYVDIRAQFIEAQELVDKAALDPYTFVRRTYLQRRNYLTYDGAPPRKDDDE